MLESRLEDANKLLQFYMTREKSLVDERDGLLVSVNRLQRSLQEQCHLREENNRLKTDMADLKQQSEKRGSKPTREGSKPTRERWLLTVEAKDAELKKLLEMKDLDLEEMTERLNNQEKERQSELLQLQLEFGAKLARVQSSAQRSQQHHHHHHHQQQQEEEEEVEQQQQQQHHGSGLLPLTVYKRKLHFFQEEKNREIVALRQRIKELEENQPGCSRLKKRRL